MIYLIILNKLLRMPQLNINLIGIVCDYNGFDKNLDFDIPFYEKHISKLDWGNLGKNENIPEQFFEKYISLFYYR